MLGSIVSLSDNVYFTGVLKPKLPYNEFVKPSRSVLEGDAEWIGHFEERDRKFFLSDIHEYLRLFYK